MDLMFFALKYFLIGCITGAATLYSVAWLLLFMFERKIHKYANKRSPIDYEQDSPSHAKKVTSRKYIQKV